MAFALETLLTKNFEFYGTDTKYDICFEHKGFKLSTLEIHQLCQFTCHTKISTSKSKSFSNSNKLAKARKMRRPPGTLGLKKFGPVKFGSKKFGPKIFLLIFLLNWTILKK